MRPPRRESNVWQRCRQNTEYSGAIGSPIMAGRMGATADLAGTAVSAQAPRPYYVPLANEETVFKAAYRRGLSILLKGPTGCGKTRFVEAMAHDLDRPLITVSCHDDLTTADLVGRFHRSVIGRFAHAYVSDDILDLDDRIIDQNARDQRHCDQRHHVDREADQLKRSEGRDDGERNGGGGALPASCRPIRLRSASRARQGRVATPPIAIRAGIPMPVTDADVDGPFPESAVKPTPTAARR